jgi:hypothetical protein
MCERPERGFPQDVRPVVPNFAVVTYGRLVTALERLLFVDSAVRVVSRSKPLNELTPALSAGVSNEFCYLSALRR